MTHMQSGIENALSQLEMQKEQMQASTVNEVFQSNKFNKIRDNFYSTIEQKQKESEEQMDLLNKELDGLTKYIKFNRKEFRREYKQRRAEREG